MLFEITQIETESLPWWIAFPTAFILGFIFLKQTADERRTRRRLNRIENNLAGKADR